MTDEPDDESPLSPLPEPAGDDPLAGVPRGLFARLCFDRGDYALLGIVNDVLSRQGSTSLRRLLAPYLHPHGIKEMAAPKGLRIAYATIHLLGSLEVGLAGDRLTALRSLRDEVMVSAESGLEKNTARVLLQIMKELVRARGNPRRQLELAHDFRAAVPGKPRVVRRLLAEHHLLEMPEAWNQLAFDDHVHDANTKGRKSPTHLIMDAWIKGIRRLTVIHYHFVRQETASELLEAAAIMDMDVHIGIECLARHDGELVKIVWTPRGLARPHEFAEFLAAPGVKEFMRQGFELSLRRQRYVLALLAAFNDRHRPALNARHGLDLPPLDAEEFLAFVGAGQASVHHLARFIRESLRPHLDRLSEANIDAVHGRDDACALVVERDALDTEALLDAYLSPAANPDIPLPEAAAPGDPLPERLSLSPQDLVARIMGLHRQNRITLVAAELPIEDVLCILAQCRGAITTLEIFNLRVHEESGRDAGEVLELLSVLNTGNVVALKRLIHRVADRTLHHGADPAKAARVRDLATDIAALAAAYRKKPLAARIGTDSSGQSTRHHGMGLVVRDTLPTRARRQLARAARHAVPDQPSQRQAIPVGVAVTPRLTALPEECCRSPLSAWFFRLLRALPGLPLAGYRTSLEWVGRRYYKATAKKRQHLHPGRHPAQGQRPLPGRGHGRPAPPAPDLAHAQWTGQERAENPGRFRRGLGLLCLGQLVVAAGLVRAGDLVRHHGAAQRDPVGAGLRRPAAQPTAVLEGFREPGSAVRFAALYRLFGAPARHPGQDRAPGPGPGHHYHDRPPGPVFGHGPGQRHLPGLPQPVARAAPGGRHRQPVPVGRVHPPGPWASTNPWPGCWPARAWPRRNSPCNPSRPSPRSSPRTAWLRSSRGWPTGPATSACGCGTTRASSSSSTTPTACWSCSTPRRTRPNCSKPPRP